MAEMALLERIRTQLLTETGPTVVLPAVRRHNSERSRIWLISSCAARNDGCCVARSLAASTHCFVRSDTASCNVRFARQFTVSANNHLGQRAVVRTIASKINLDRVSFFPCRLLVVIFV
jgi:hypothetical protein